MACTHAQMRGVMGLSCAECYIRDHPLHCLQAHGRKVYAVWNHKGSLSTKLGLAAHGESVEVDLSHTL